MKKFIKKVLGYGIASILSTMWFLGIMIIINDYVEWTCADNTRFSISTAIGLVIITILFLREVAKQP